MEEIPGYLMGNYPFGYMMFFLVLFCGLLPVLNDHLRLPWVTMGSPCWALPMSSRQPRCMLGICSLHVFCFWSSYARSTLFNSSA